MKAGVIFIGIALNMQIALGSIDQVTDCYWWDMNSNIKEQYFLCCMEPGVSVSLSRTAFFTWGPKKENAVQGVVSATLRNIVQGSVGKQ